MTRKQLFKRISHRLSDYYRANVSPVYVPRGTAGAKLPQQIDLIEAQDSLQVDNKESFIVNLQTIKQVCTELEQEVVKLRLMGYRVSEVSKIVGVPLRTVERALQNIQTKCANA